MTETEKEYYSPCPWGLEDVLAEELRELGAAKVDPRPGGAAYRGDRELGYRACLWLRTAIRVQETIYRGKIESEDELYEAVRSVDWSGYMGLDDTLKVRASLRDSKMTHSRYAEQRVKDAVVDQFRELKGARPDVELERPDIPIHLALLNDYGILSRDLAGESLHKRGWRPIQVKSPLNECIAAGMALMSGWKGETPLVDPMCGSGTLLVEAAFIALDRPPGLDRNFAFEQWPDFDGELWRGLLEEAHDRIGDTIDVPIEGADRHGGSIGLARKGSAAAGVNEFITYKKSPITEFEPTETPGVVLVNPPYGHRVGEGEELQQAWYDLGTFLHEKCGGATAWVLCGDPELSQHLRLRSDQKHPIRNGPIECRLLEYSIFS